MKIIYKKTGECINSLKEFDKLLESIEDWDLALESIDNLENRIKRIEEISKTKDSEHKFYVEQFDGTVDEYIELGEKLESKFGDTYSIYGEGLVPVYTELMERWYFNER